ncbi:MAG TPA: hypothetical protein VHL77_04210, partial [Ferruginibacter sp.]|nr:hypothetical protein [Ferruginibacter sp.]
MMFKKRLAESERKLLEMNGSLDNGDLYVIQSQFRKVRSLLKKVDDDLPVDESGLPRIYKLMQEFVFVNDAQVEFSNLIDFISKKILQTNELRSVRVLVKMALLENISNVAERLTQAKERLSLKSSISSLRLLDTVDWELFMDATSRVESILRKEKCGIYPSMDYYTRDSYLDAVTGISKQSGIEETAVAERAVLLADAAVTANHPSPVMRHVGNYLIGAGQNQLLQSLGVHAKKEAAILRLKKGSKVRAYISGIVVLTFLFAALLLAGMPHKNAPAWQLIATAIILLICTSEIAKLIMDSIVSFVTKPALLPRLDYAKGIPSECSSLVAIPAILSTAAEIDELVHALEVRYHANKISNLYFALVTDFKDATSETLPGDKLMLDKMISKVRELNERYTGKVQGLFFLFHRPRKWNAAEKVWMGYERKRGKLMDLNLLLRGRGADRFTHIEGDVQLLQEVKYVITLDSDTLLPRDAAWKMVATMAH